MRDAMPRSFPPSPALPMGMVGIGAAIGIGLIVLSIAYRAEENSNSGATSGDEQLGATATQVEDHAAVVRQHGERMIEIGQAEAQDLWIEQGTKLLAEARRLVAAADQIRRTDNDRSMFHAGAGVDIYRLRADGRALREAGQTLVDHAAAFAETADKMTSQAQALGSPELANSAELMKESASGMATDGRSVISAAQPVLNEADQLERSLGH
jgi:hypothetical protein